MRTVTLGFLVLVIGTQSCPALQYPEHHVILRVVHVTPDWHEYDIWAGGWPSAVPVRESTRLKYFEAAIWEETQSIHLYEFDNEFDPHLGLTPGVTPQQMTAHRESYRVMQVPGMPQNDSAAGEDARSLFIRTAFEDFVSHIAEKFPDSGHHLMYSGHGGPGGRLFGGQLQYRDAGEMLGYWASLLGRRLGFIDMGGPCNKGSFSDLENFCRYAAWYVASDLPNGGYEFDEWTPERNDETNPELQYHRLFSEADALEELLVGRIDLLRLRYEYSRVNMTENRTQQANYLYSCTEFMNFGPAFRHFLDEIVRREGIFYSSRDDLHDFMERHSAPARLMEGFSHLIAHRADNRDFFQWEQGSNGLLMPADDWLEK